MMYPNLVICIVGLLLIRHLLRRRKGVCRCTVRIPQHLVIVTGANTGIGFETAKDLAGRGARVILACRDEERGKTAQQKIIKHTGNEKVEYRHLDLSSFRSIRCFVADLVATERKLDVLVNNAGVGKRDNSYTEDRIVTEMQTNYFGPFLLTNLLLPLLRVAPQGRIVNVSSIAHFLGTIHLETLNKPASGRLGHQLLYSDAKLCNILFTLELKRRLEQSRLTANCLHPGMVSTDIYRNVMLPVRLFLHFMMPKNAKEGAQTSIHLAVAPQLKFVSGKYFVDCIETNPSIKAQNAALARKLWDVTEKIIGSDKMRLIPAQTM